MLLGSVLRLTERHITVAVILLVVLLLGGATHPSRAVGAGQCGLERFLVFTDGDPGVGAAVRDRVQRRGGRVVDEVHVGPDLALLVVLIPRVTATELAGISGVREVVPDFLPSPAEEGEPVVPEGVAPSDCGGPEHGHIGSQA
jgi:hypothetical protein